MLDDPTLNKLIEQRRKDRQRRKRRWWKAAISLLLLCIVYGIWDLACEVQYDRDVALTNEVDRPYNWDANSYARIRKLVHDGAEVNGCWNHEIDDEKWKDDCETLLIYAVYYRQKDIARALIDSNINFNWRDAKGRTALSLARQLHDSDMVDLLEKAHAQP